MPDYIPPQQVRDQANALTADNDFTQADAQYFINWILSQGNLSGNPRDLIQIRRGLKQDLPNLAQGEMAFCIDTKELYVGGEAGNVLVNTATQQKYIFISDSYDAYGGWISKVANTLGLTLGVDYWNIALSGASFVDGRFLSQLQSWVAANGSQTDSITQIVCVGGINDSDASALTLLPSRLNEFKAYVTGALPNAVIKLGYVGFALDTSPILYGRTANFRTFAQGVYARAETFGMEYLNGCELVLHNRSLLDSDGLHPNGQGGTQIAEAVSNALKSGTATIQYKADSVIIPVSGTMGGAISQSIAIGQLTTTVNYLAFSGINKVFSNNQWVEIADVKLALGNTFPPTSVRVTLTVEGVNRTYDAVLTVLNDKLIMRVSEIDSSTGTYYNINVTNIGTMDFTVSVAGIND